MSDFLVPDWPAPPSVGALSTTRRGGVSRPPYDDGAGGGGLNLGTHVGDEPDAVRHNRALLRAHLPAEPAWLSQVHGTTVLDAETVAAAPEADASMATCAGLVCAVQTADCLPVLLCDRAGKVVAAAHAGWRGLAGGVLENTVARMRMAGADDIMAWLGPAIGPRSFEVGGEVRAAFGARDPAAASAFSGQPATGKYLADLYLLARMSLGRAGVERVYGGGRCTVQEAHDFYSFRRDRATGRMASLIWLR
jgi:YfiH family protein